MIRRWLLALPAAAFDTAGGQGEGFLVPPGTDTVPQVQVRRAPRLAGNVLSTTWAYAPAPE